MAESSEKMPPYPDIFTDGFQMSDQVKYDIAYMRTTGKMYNV